MSCCTGDQGSSSQTGITENPKSDGGDTEDESEVVTEERAYQAMFVLIKLVTELDSLVEQDASKEVKEAVALRAFLKEKWEVPVGHVCPRYLLFRTENLLEQRDRHDHPNLQFCANDHEAWILLIDNFSPKRLPLTDRTTENDSKVLEKKSAGEKGIRLFSVCDIMDGYFVCEYWGLTETPFNDGI
eukprot:3281129-Rhodomonas_salina.1